jgi:hypothetical protein
MFFTIVTVIVVSIILITLLDISSTNKITQQNIEFIKDVYDRSTEHYQNKLKQLMDWHIAYHHPFLVERSYKIHTPTGKINDDRFAIFIDLGAFLTQDGHIYQKKWLEFSTIINIPLEIEKKCIDSMLKGEQQVDLIWGLDPLEEKEKIYLEYPSKGLIESYIVEDQEVTDRYEYIKRKTNRSCFKFMYTRTNRKGEKDSFHYVLTNPIQKDNKTIYVISYSPSSETKTYYYRYQ